MTSINYWQGSLVRLRATEPTDLDTFYQWNLDSEAARMLEYVWPPSSTAMLRDYVEEQSKRKPMDDCIKWIIETGDCLPIGTIDTHHANPRSGTFSYGIFVDRNHRGRGYAAAAIKLVLRYYFEELRYQKCTISIHADNPACIRLHEKLGFTHEGTLRRMVFTHGKYVDELYYGITAEEFHA